MYKNVMISEINLETFIKDLNKFEFYLEACLDYDENKNTSDKELINICYL
jgi:hypothetical protein